MTSDPLTATTASTENYKFPSGLKRAMKWGIAIVCYYVWFQAFYNAVRFGTVFPYRDFMDMLGGVKFNFPPIFTIFVLNILIVSRSFNIPNLLVKVLLQFCLSIGMVGIVNWLFMVINAYVLSVNPFIDWAGSILNDIIIFMGVEMVSYVRDLIRSRQEAEMAKRREIQYQYDSLRAQINPHFLFNSLNILNSLVTINPLKSKEFIHALAGMYRYILVKQGQEKADVEEELDFLHSYVKVLSMRYTDKFRVEISGTVPEGRKLIPFTMQLLIENVTKHNVISVRKPMTVTIALDEEGIRISNPVRPRQCDTKGGVGLRYLKELYAAHGRDFRVAADGDSFVAYVPFI